MRDQMAVVLDLEKRLYRAQLASDVAVLDALIADDLLFTGPAGHLFTKQQDLAMHKAGTMKVSSLEVKDTQAVAFGEGLVAVTIIADVAGIFEGTPSSGTYRYLRVWRFQEGNWQVIAGSMHQIA